MHLCGVNEAEKCFHRAEVRTLVCTVVGCTGSGMS